MDIGDSCIVIIIHNYETWSIGTWHACLSIGGYYVIDKATKHCIISSNENKNLMALYILAHYKVSSEIRHNQILSVITIRGECNSFSNYSRVTEQTNLVI